MYDDGRDRIRQVQGGLLGSTVPALVQDAGNDSKAALNYREGTPILFNLVLSTSYSFVNSKDALTLEYPCLSQQNVTREGMTVYISFLPRSAGKV